MNYSSKLLENAVDEIAQLPSIGKRTALRLALHLLKQPKTFTHQLAESISLLVDNVILCSSCYSISDEKICEICANPSRDERIICVVEDIRDVMAIENTLQFKGKYHVLGGKISPIEGISPQDLYIDPLIKKIKKGVCKELIFALSPTIEGDTTNYYIYKQVNDLPLKISTIARGIAVGNELEYADEVTLGKSILNRIPFEGSI